MMGVFIPMDDRPHRLPLGWVVQENGCWDWVGATALRRGYGMVRTRTGHQQQAHRFSYERFVGPIPEGLTIDHLCRNRACGNPAHMEPVTGKENTLRGIGPTACNARKAYCKRGHLLSGDNVYQHGRSGRMCRTCQRHRKGRWP
jgi:hypothetical protein